MKINIELADVDYSKKSILRQLIELYEYDFSEYNGADLNENGFYDYKYLDHYWTDEGRHPYFILVDGHYAGFALVNSCCYALKDDNAKSIAEFFVMRKYRRQRIGQHAAKLVFDKFKAPWEVLQHPGNAPSQVFWQNVVDEYTGGKYELRQVQTDHWKGQGLLFHS